MEADLDALNFSHGKSLFHPVNVLNIKNSGFVELTLLQYDIKRGSDYSFSTILSDNRFYKSINKTMLLAAQLLGQFSIRQPPFNQLSLLGGESLMRGITPAGIEAET